MTRRTVLILLFSTLVLTTQAETVSEEVTCPCSFIVRQQKSAASTFDIIVTRPHSSPFKTLLNYGFPSSEILEHLSTRHVSSRDAVKSDEHFHYFQQFGIKEQGTFRISLHPNTNDEKHASLQLHTSSRQPLVRCPVVLSPDPPSLRLLSKDRSIRGIPHGMPNITRASLQPTIVGGYQLSASLLPFLVNILTDDGFVCSGTLIAPTWVVTASHCNVQTTTTVRVNSRQVANDGTIVPVKRVIFEPRGGPDAEVGDFFDIMLVELDMDVRDLGLNSFMRVNLNRKFPRANSFVRAIGYGAISDDEIIPDPARFSVRQNDLPVTPFKQCERKYVAGTSNTDSLSNKFQFCAGYINEAGCGTCGGDSGGPVIQYAGTTPVIVGIISAGVRCSRFGFPGIMVKIAGHKRFLNRSPANFRTKKRRLRQVRRSCPVGQFLVSPGGALAICINCPPGTTSTGGTTAACF